MRIEGRGEEGNKAEIVRANQLLTKQQREEEKGLLPCRGHLFSFFPPVWCHGRREGGRKKGGRVRRALHDTHGRTVWRRGQILPPSHAAVKYKRPETGYTAAPAVG